MPVSRRFSLATFLIAALPVLALTACEDNADKSLAASQSCLNKATASNVDTCLIPIAGQTTAASYAIRCSADFIAQGFTNARLNSAFQDLSNGNTTVKPMLTAVAYLAMYTMLPNGHTQDNALNNCTLSQDDSYRRIAEFAKYSTTLAAQPSSSSVQTTTTAKNTITGELGDTSVQADVGAQTLVLYQDFCVKKSPFSGTDICKTIETYKDAGSNQQIGLGIMSYLVM